MRRIQICYNINVMNIDISNLRIKDISEVDLTSVFLHYTNTSNLEGIFARGLEPHIGKNSKGIEKSSKVFFTIGDTGALVIMDAWLKWLILRPENQFVYESGSFFMTRSWFPKVIITIIFNRWIKSEKRLRNACKKLKNILDESVYLILDLEEHVDFDLNDIDEVKSQSYSRSHLEHIYSYGIANGDKHEFWNMRTYTGKIIDKKKVTLLKINNIYSANEILKYLANKQIDYIENNCPFLMKYLEYLEKGDFNLP